jgi:hypothetical protein
MSYHPYPSYKPSSILSPDEPGVPRGCDRQHLQPPNSEGLSISSLHRLHRSIVLGSCAGILILISGNISYNWPYRLPFQWQAAGVVFYGTKNFFLFFLDFPGVRFSLIVLIITGFPVNRSL